MLDKWTEQEQKSLFSVEVTSSKFSNVQQIEWTLCSNAYRINSVYQKLKLKDNLHNFGKKES